MFVGFAFVTFESAAVVERVLEVHFHEINNKMVECKQAKPKEELSPPPSRGRYCLVLVYLLSSIIIIIIIIMTSGVTTYYFSSRMRFINHNW